MKEGSILVCDLEGAFGHFRKFYTNSSSLTYAFPPPTSVAGLLAGILGIERDEYYGIFSSNKFRCAVEICFPVRKLIQTVNYILTVSSSDVNKAKGSTQVPFELVVSKAAYKNIYSKLRYRLYFTHQDKSLLEEIRERVKKQLYSYPPYLGVTECTGKFTYVAELLPEEITVMPPGEEIEINTVCNLNHIQKGSLEIKVEDSRRYIKELIPIEFDENRMLKISREVVYEEEGKGIKGKFNVPVLRTVVEGKEKNLLWLQEVKGHEDLFPY